MNALSCNFSMTKITGNVLLIQLKSVPGEIMYSMVLETNGRSMRNIRVLVIGIKLHSILERMMLHMQLIIEYHGL